MMRFFVHQHHKSRIFANNSHVALSTPDDCRGREKEKDIEKLRSRYVQEAMNKNHQACAIFCRNAFHAFTLTWQCIRWKKAVSVEESVCLYCSEAFV